MPGLTFSNELISRDEGLYDFGIELYGLQEKLSEAHFIDIVSEAVSIEKEITESTL